MEFNMSQENLIWAVNKYLQWLKSTSGELEKAGLTDSAETVNKCKYFLEFYLRLANEKTDNGLNIIG